MSQQPLVVSLKYPKVDDGFSTPPPQRPAQKPKKASAKKQLLAALAVAVVVGAGYAAYIFLGHPGTAAPPITTTPNADTQKAAQKVQDIISRVGRHIVLPEGETPTVASVTDPSKLADQPFFKKAKAGDQVLLYTQAKMAYLYDPALDKLVEVAPITTEAAVQ